MPQQRYCGFRSRWGCRCPSTLEMEWILIEPPSFTLFRVIRLLFHQIDDDPCSGEMVTQIRHAEDEIRVAAADSRCCDGLLLPLAGVGRPHVHWWAERTRQLPKQPVAGSVPFRPRSALYHYPRFVTSGPVLFMTSWMAATATATIALYSGDNGGRVRRDRLLLVVGCRPNLRYGVGGARCHRLRRLVPAAAFYLP